MVIIINHSRAIEAVDYENLLLCLDVKIVYMNPALTQIQAKVPTEFNVRSNYKAYKD